MFPRRLTHTAVVLLAVLGLLVLCPPSGAQDPAQPEVQNSRYQFAGLVNANAVFVRSGPSENDYATMKLDKGTELTVVGIIFEWLKIMPPEGSFCYVAKAYVNRAGNGTIGQVTNTLNVRVGSALNPLKTKVAAKLEPGARVEIVGEQDEYFKIRPPQGVYLYVNKQFVDPVRQVNVAADNTFQAEAPAPAAQQALPDTTSTPADTMWQTNPGPQTGAQPGGPTQSSGAAPSTQPVANAEAEFDRLETTYAQVSQRPLDEQPVEELLAGYQALTSSGNLPESMRRICDFKISVLKTRAEAKAQFLGARQVQDDMKQKQMALRAEQEELEQRIKQADLRFYTAVGTLRTSSLQQGRQTLYRLTDPANGRTVVYLRSDDNKLGQYIGQFIGVRGELHTDSQLNLRVISPQVFEIVNPAKVGQSVAAQIVPPSLLPGGVGTASAGHD